MGQCDLECNTTDAFVVADAYSTNTRERKKAKSGYFVYCGMLNHRELQRE